MYKPKCELQKLEDKWNKRNKLEFRKSYLKAYWRIWTQNYLWNCKFKYNFYEIREALNKYVENITLEDISHLIK